jgi:hypothetical protein
MKKILIVTALLFSTSASAAPYGTYYNPVQDPPFTGDWSVPVHRGMYCVQGTWHRGWLRPWEGSIVIKPSCGTAVYQLPG